MFGDAISRPNGEPQRFGGQVAVVTGGGSGIGLAIVRMLLAEGATVIVGDFDNAGVERVLSEIGPRGAALVTDVRSEEQVIALAEAAASFGLVSLGFNAAGIGEGGPILDLRMDEWDRVLGVCLTGVFLAVKHEARQMREYGGSIVNIASLNSSVPAFGATAYSVAKAGVAMLTKNAALDLGAYGIRVNAVAPGLVNTPMAVRTGHMAPAVQARWLEHTPLGRIGRPDDIAEAALFLASSQASWVTGETMYVDGGQSLTAYPDVRDVIGDDT
jgi:3-oxoacyl-[acyl-carrier protein] reductase